MSSLVLPSGMAPVPLPRPAGDDPTALVVRNLFAGAVSEAFIAENTERARGPQLSLSGLGGCSRAAAYAIAGTEPSDTPVPDEARAATLGTWEHAGLLPRLSAGFGGDHEVAVTLRAAGIVVPGHADLVAPLPKGIARQDGAVALADAKTVGEHRLNGVRRNGAYQDHRVQVWGYALACHQAGMPVEWVVWLYMDRATGDLEVVVERFTTGGALAVLDHVRRLRTFADTNPDMAPREAAGPGLSFACDRCWWLKRCWGEEAVPGETGAQRNLIRNDADREAALLMYYDAVKAESEAKKRKEYAKALLDRTPSGRWGSWELKRSRPGSRLDQKEAKRLLAEAGVNIPMNETQGSISVKPVEQITDSVDQDV